VFSYGQNFVSDKVEANDSGAVHIAVEIAIHGIANHEFEFVEGVSLGMDADSECGGGVASVDVFQDFKDDFFHREKVQRLGEKVKRNGGSGFAAWIAAARRRWRRSRGDGEMAAEPRRWGDGGGGALKVKSL